LNQSSTFLISQEGAIGGDGGDKDFETARPFRTLTHLAHRLVFQMSKSCANGKSPELQDFEGTMQAASQFRGAQPHPARRPLRFKVAAAL
jgi:hypothetical protein